MIVCICKGLSCCSIKETIRQGNFTLEKVKATCGAGTDCGSCVRKVEKMVDQEKRKLLEEKMANVNKSVDDLREAFGELTLNDLFDMLVNLVEGKTEEKEEVEPEKTDDGETLQ